MEKIQFEIKKSGNKYFRFLMKQEEYHQLDEEYSGLCIKCGAVREGDTEPDARKYHCEECGKSFAYGMQELLLMGLIRFKEQ